MRHPVLIAHADVPILPDADASNAGVVVVEEHPRKAGKKVEVLDGDVVRTNLSKGLGFSKEDRDTNIRRIGFVAQLLTRNGVFCICAAISPYREVRDENRKRIGNFMEVYTRCPIPVLKDRDPNEIEALDRMKAAWAEAPV